MIDPLRVISALFMDRSEPLGNSPGKDGRQALHVVLKNIDPIPVSAGSLEAVSVFSEALAVPNAVETTVLNYTVPPGKNFRLSHIEVEGNNVASFRITKNAVTIARTRFGWTQYFQRMDFNADSGGSYILTAGQSLVVNVIQESRKTAGNYSARTVGILENVTP